MTITTIQTLNQKAAKPTGKEHAPIIPKANTPFTLGQIKGAIPPHLFKHSLLVRYRLGYYHLFTYLHVLAILSFYTQFLSNYVHLINSSIDYGSETTGL
jgi:hypothetical protein